MNKNTLFITFKNNSFFSTQVKFYILKCEFLAIKDCLINIMGLICKIIFNIMKSFIRFILFFFVGLILFGIIDAILEGGGVILLIGISLLAYLIPTLVAFARKVPSTLSIAVLNIFLGWSIIGFVVSLVWALKNYDYVPPDLRNK